MIFMDTTNDLAVTPHKIEGIPYEAGEYHPWTWQSGDLGGWVHAVSEEEARMLARSALRQHLRSLAVAAAVRSWREMANPSRLP